MDFKFDFNFDPEKFTIGDWITPHHQIHIGDRLIDGILDWFYISKLENLQKFVSLYDVLEEILVECWSNDAHVFQRFFIEKIGLSEILEFRYANKNDVEIEYKTKRNLD